MRKRGQRRQSRVDRGSLAVAGLALLFVLLPVEAGAAVTCSSAGTGDFDGDRFTDTVECAGIALPNGTVVTLNPNVEDFFVILQRSNPSLLPSDPFVFISKPVTQGGLGWISHLVDSTQAPGQLVGGVKVIRVTESQDLNGDTLGFADAGQDLVIVWTARIRRHIVGVYAGAGIAEASIPPNVFTDYYNHTTAQEVGHLLALKTICDARWGPGCHDKDGAALVMERSVKYTVKGGHVTFYTGVNFTSADQNGALPPQ